MAAAPAAVPGVWSRPSGTGSRGGLLLPKSGRTSRLPDWQPGLWTFRRAPAPVPGGPSLCSPLLARRLPQPGGAPPPRPPGPPCCDDEASGAACPLARPRGNRGAGPGGVTRGRGRWARLPAPVRPPSSFLGAGPPGAGGKNLDFKKRGVEGPRGAAERQGVSLAAAAAAQGEWRVGEENARVRLCTHFSRVTQGVYRFVGTVACVSPSPQLAGGECRGTQRQRSQAEVKEPGGTPPRASALPPCSTPTAGTSGPQGVASRLVSAPWHCRTTAA